MKSPHDIRRRLTRRFSAHCREWLAGGGAWPLSLSLGAPSEREALERADAAREWARAWHAWRGAGVVDWVEKRWRNLGTQKLPAKLTLASATEVAEWAGELERWQRAERRYGDLLQRWPALAAGVAARSFDELADYSEADFARLTQMLSWLCANPAACLYPRQLPVAGLDTKWLQSRAGLIADFVEAARGLPPSSGGRGDFYRRCGLKSPPRLARLRLLDSRLAARLGGLSDISAPLAQLAEMDLNLDKVLVVENLQTGLACEGLAGAAVIMRLGYDVDALSRLPWLGRARCVYWGDLDTHGFAILSRARAFLPAMRSALMDRETLLRYRDLWVEETSQHSADTLPRLTAAEQALYRALKRNAWGRNIRLEQERIAWDYAWAQARRAFDAK